MSHPDADFLRDYLAPLKGATIVAVGVNEEDDDGFPEAWPTLKVRATDGQTFDLEVSQDEEGNGPGFIFGLPHPGQRKEQT